MLKKVVLIALVVVMALTLMSAVVITGQTNAPVVHQSVASIRGIDRYAHHPNCPFPNAPSCDG
jgi:hypothetical protein